VELVMEMFVNTSGVPLNTTKPRLDGRIFGWSETDIISHHYQVSPLSSRSIWRYFEACEQWSNLCWYLPNLIWQNIL